MISKNLARQKYECAEPSDNKLVRLTVEFSVVLVTFPFTHHGNLKAVTRNLLGP